MIGALCAWACITRRRRLGPASNPRRVASAVAEAPHEAMAWGNVCDPDREDSDVLEFSLFRSLSPNRVQEVSENFLEPVVFVDIRPAPEAYGAVSFGCGLYDDDVLSTAASESEDSLADTSGSLPPGGQERRSSPSYSELLDVVTRAVDKLGLDWEGDAAQAQSQSKLDNRFPTSRAPALLCKPLPLFPDLHQEVSRSCRARNCDHFGRICSRNVICVTPKYIWEHLRECK